MIPPAAATVPLKLLVSIDDDECRDPDRVGAKAARLALAKAAGLPVPESLAVPCEASTEVLAAATLEVDGRGIHACRLEVMTADRSGLSGLAALTRRLGSSLAVRSSAPLEDDPKLAGAFNSLVGVSPEEVPTAVLAVWASAIREASGPPRMGVLIQPELVPSWAGTAELVVSASVEVTAARGSAQALTAGWATGTSATVLRSGDIAPQTAVATVDASVLRAAAALARDVWSAIGDDRIEWAFADGCLWLIQSGRARRAAPRFGPPSGGPGLAGEQVDRSIAVRAARWAGDLAERWILPWAIARDARPFDDGPPRPRQLEDPVAVWDTIARMSAQLTAQVWGARQADAGRAAASIAALRRGTDSSVGSVLAALRPPDPEMARRCLELCGYVAGHLLARKVIDSAGQFWSLPADPLPALRGTAAIANSYNRSIRAALRWEPLLYSAVAAGGTQSAGVAAAYGMGCGPAVLASEAALASRQSRGLSVRSVIVARYPLPRYSPLLLGAAGLVAHGGSQAAHLVTVARSLGVPTVLGCDLSATVQPGSYAYIAVDGGAGLVSVLSVG